MFAVTSDGKVEHARGGTDPVGSSQNPWSLDAASASKTAHQIAVSGHEMWLISQDHKAWYRYMSTGNWSIIEGPKLKRIAVSRTDVWALGLDGTVYARKAPAGEWSTASGLAATHIAVSGTGVWAVDHQSMLNYRDISLDESDQVWIQIPGVEVVYVSASGDEVWAVDTSGTVFFR